MHIWLRHESSPTELRAPLVPADAAALVAAGHTVTVEESAQRWFATDGYAAAGCRIVDPGSWPGAPPEAFVLGIKEPPPEPVALHHRHVFFGHAYKGQAGAARLLDRFTGGGVLLDLEYLTDEVGRRAAAFGYWAGYVGAALAVLHGRGALPTPLRATTRDEFDAALRRSGGGTTALVIGALGRCGSGARAALTTAGVDVTGWDLAETRAFDRAAVLDHDLLINAVLSTEPGPPFLAPADVGAGPRRLRVVADVTCDVTSEFNRLPVNDRTTSWDHPARRIHDTPPLDLIVIDNLPSLLPGESSDDFSAALLPYLGTLDDPGPAWQRCRRQFESARAARLS